MEGAAAQSLEGKEIGFPHLPSDDYSIYKGHLLATQTMNYPLEIPQITLQLHSLIPQNLANSEVMIPDFSDSRQISLGS